MIMPKYDRITATLCCCDTKKRFKSGHTLLQRSTLSEAVKSSADSALTVARMSLYKYPAEMT